MMLHPSYMELIEKANRDVAPDEEPVIRSRYSIIHAAAKRAHQLVEGAVPLAEGDEKKPLSLAVKELDEGQIHIVRSDAPSIAMGEAMDREGLLGAGEQLIGATDVTVDASELVGGPSVPAEEAEEAETAEAAAEAEEVPDEVGEAAGEAAEEEAE